MQIGTTVFASRFQITQTSASRFELGGMMCRDRLAHGAGTTVDHEPKQTVLISLKLKEVVAPAQGSELNQPITVLEFFQ